MMITAFSKLTGPALGVRQATVVEHLQERVEDVRVGLLDLVEEHHRVRAALTCSVSCPASS
jgi:hypothetical protein